MNAKNSEISTKISLLTASTSAKEMMKISTQTKISIKFNSIEIEKEIEEIEKTIRNSSSIILIANQLRRRSFDVESKSNTKIFEITTSVSIVINLNAILTIAKISSRIRIHLKRFFKNRNQKSNRFDDFQSN